MGSLPTGHTWFVMRFWYLTDGQRHLARCSGAGISYEASDEPLGLLAVGSLQLFTAELLALLAALRLLSCSSRSNCR